MKAKSLLALVLALLMTVSMCFTFSALAEDEATTDIVYDPREVLNDLAGDYGIGGSQYASGSKTTVDYSNSVFSVKAYNSSENTKNPNQIVPMATAKFQSDSTHYRLRFLGASETRGSLEIFEYNRGGADRRALWWIRGDKWREEEPLLIFTAPKDGTYDITAPANSPEVKFSNSAKNALTGTYENMSVTFSIEKYEAGADVLASANVLSSATISKATNYKAAFPAVLDVELKAGDTIVFRLSSDLARNVDSGAYRTETEATPIITLKGAVNPPAEPENPDEEEESDGIVYNPTALLNDLAGDYGIGGSQFANGNKTTVDYTRGVFSVKAYNSSENTKNPNQIVPMATAKFQADSTHYRLRFLGASEIRGSLEIFEYNRGGADRRALWWIRGDKWREEEPLLIFTAPKNGTYDITAPANSPEVKFSNSAKNALTGTYENMSVTFSIEKYEAGADILASANVLSSVTISKATNYKAAFPAVHDLELKAGDMIVFRLSSDLARNVDSGAYRTETEATPVITLTEIDDTNVAPILSVEKAVVSTMVGEAVTLPVKAFDPNEDDITVIYTTEAANGTVALDAAAGTLTYTPKEGFAGEDTFTLKLSDGVLESEPVTVKVGVYKSISAAVPAIKETVAFFYDEPQGSDWLDMDQTISDWQWQVAYDGLRGTNEDGFRVAEMAVWSETGGITLAHTDAPAMNITKQDILILNCDKPKGKHAKGALTYVAPEDGLYKLTHTDVMATIGLDKYRVLNPPATDAYTTPVYVSITKDNKIVWPADGKPHKFDPADKENFEVPFPEIVTAMKKGDSLRIVVEMDENCKSWMNRVWCDPVVYNMGAYDEAKDLNPEGFYEEEEDDNDQTGGSTDDGSAGGSTDSDITDDSDDSVEDDNESESPDTGRGFPVAMAVLGLLSAAALVITKKN